MLALEEGVRAMVVRGVLVRARVSVLVCALVIIPAGCDTGGRSSPDPRTAASPAQSAQSAQSAPTAASASSAPDSVSPSPVLRRQVVPCSSPSGRTRSWTMHGIATVAKGWVIQGRGLLGMVVARDGTATVAWSGPRPMSAPMAGADLVGLADDPAAPGDPQDPTHGAQVEATVPEFSDHLGIDAAGTQTLLYQDDRGPTSDGSDEFYDLVLSDRAPGAGWATSPALIRNRELTEEKADLAVNASGAAVASWSEFRSPGGDEVLYASYRKSAGAAWTAPQRLPIPGAFVAHVGIDDAGRVLLVYDRILDKHAGVWALRRTASGHWVKRHRLSGPGTELFSSAVGAGGAAVVTSGHVDGDGRSDRPPFTVRMSPGGRWGAPVSQPNGLGVFGLKPAGMDARGRALIVGWEGADLVGRWSRPDGRWRAPFDITAGVPKPNRFPLEVAVNRRGDALVVWAVQARVAQLWARYKPVGQAWTKPARISRADSPPRWFDAAVGDCGHVAIAWTTHHNRQVQIRRASPTR